MDELFDFKISRKDSFELNNHSEGKKVPLSLEIKKNNPSPTLGSPSLPRKSIKVEFSMQKVRFNLSINPKKNDKSEKSGSNHMVRSMMPSLNQKKPKERFSVLNPSMNIENVINENKVRTSRTRHNSLTYSKRNKYVSSFDGKSLFLSKLIRPESRDNKLIFLEENFGKVDTDTICPQSSLLRKKPSISEKINSDKSKFFSKQSQFKKNNENDCFLTIKRTSIDKRMEEENKGSESSSNSDSENGSHASNKESKLENHVNFKVLISFLALYRIFYMYNLKKWKKESMNS